MSAAVSFRHQVEVARRREPKKKEEVALAILLEARETNRLLRLLFVSLLPSYPYHFPVLTAWQEAQTGRRVPAVGEEGVVGQRRGERGGKEGGGRKRKRV